MQDGRLIASSGQCPKRGLHFSYKIIVIRVLFIILIHDLKFEFLPGLKNVVHHKRFFKIGIEGIIDGLCPADESPLMIGSTLEKDLNVGV